MSDRIERRDAAQARGVQDRKDAWSGRLRHHVRGGAGDDDETVIRDTVEVRAGLERRKPAISVAAMISCMVAAMLVAGLFLWRPWSRYTNDYFVRPENVGGIIAGHKYIDLGLSVKWATCNVGATTPEGYGDYFAWGETSPKSSYEGKEMECCTEGDSYDNVKFSYYVASSKYGTTDNRTRLELSDDAARANWGGSWRMPTLDEMKELEERCSWQWTTVNGHNGYKVTSKRNGRSIFLPAAGYRYGGSSYSVGSYRNYWSSSLDTSYSSNAYYLYFVSGRVDWRSYNKRIGQSVRAVSE